MTTPLFISEAPALEIRNIIKSLSPGATVKWHDVVGTIEFVDDEYITICINEKPNPPGSKQPMNKCCLLVFNKYWDELEVDDTYFNHVKSYHGKTNDHPGNELLPTIDKR
jgi:hypothetical protein